MCESSVYLCSEDKMQCGPASQKSIKEGDVFLGYDAGFIYAEVNGEYPLIPGSKPSELVASWGEFTADDKPLIEIAKLRGASLRLVEEVAFDE